MAKRIGTGESSDGARGAEPQDGDRGHSDGNITREEIRTMMDEAFTGFASNAMNKALNDQRKRFEKVLDDRFAASTPSSQDPKPDDKKSGGNDGSLEVRQLRQQVEELQKRDTERQAKLDLQSRDTALRSLIDELDVSDPKELFRRLKGDDRLKVDAETNEYFFEGPDGNVTKPKEYTEALIKSSPIWRKGNSKDGGGPTPGAMPGGGLSSEQLGKLPTAGALAQIYEKNISKKA